MAVVIETREYQEPVWEEFTWELWGQRISGVLAELPGGSKDVRKVRISLPIPRDAQNVMITVGNRNRINLGSRGNERVEEEYYLVSYWSPTTGVGRLMMVPREIALRREEGAPLMIEVVEIGVHTYNSNNQPTYKNLA